MAAAAAEHGREVYRDDNNNVDIQLQRLVRLQHLAQREIEAGWQPPALKFHDFLNALASAKMCKQPESDGVVVEMVRALSWSTLLWLYLLFLVRLDDWETESTLCHEVLPRSQWIALFHRAVSSHERNLIGTRVLFTKRSQRVAPFYHPSVGQLSTLEKEDQALLSSHFE